jgi:hypothetical protein
MAKHWEPATTRPLDGAGVDGAKRVSTEGDVRKRMKNIRLAKHVPQPHEASDRMQPVERSDGRLASSDEGAAVAVLLCCGGTFARTAPR